MFGALFSTPRDEPGHVLPAAGGAVVLLLALPVYALLGWSIAGWGLATVLWLGLHGIDYVLARVRRPQPSGVANAGGSITVSERRVSGRRAAAIRLTTPPYEWPTRCVPGSRNCSNHTASSSKSTCSTSGPGGKPRRFGATISKRSASGFWAFQVSSTLTTEP